MCFQIQLRKINKQFKVDVRAFPLICIISLKYIFGLGVSNIILLNSVFFIGTTVTSFEFALNMEFNFYK